MNLLWLLFWAFFKISLFSVGGGYNMVPLMQDEVESRGWLPPGAFMDVLAVSEATPGPVGVNLATFAGYRVAGLPGAVAATLGVCLPGAVLLFALGVLAGNLRDRPAFRAALRGILPVLVGLLAATAFRLGSAMAPPGASLPPPSSILIFAACLAALLAKNVHPFKLMLAAAAAGIAFSLPFG